MLRPRSLTVMAGLALVQGIVGTLVGLVWLQVASLFDQESGVMSSLIVMMAELRGWLLIVLALMYFVFAAGAWQALGWAWWIGLLVSALSMLTLVSILLKGGSVVLVLVCLIVPIIMIWYLLTPEGRQVLSR